MKTIKFAAVSFIAAMVLIGCQEEMMEDVAKAGTYHVSMETFETGTKTALGEGRQVVWSSDDRIAVFAGGGVGNAFQIDQAYVGDSIGEFTCVEGLFTDGHADEMAHTIAVYPFDSDLSVKHQNDYYYSISGITFPSEQTYAGGSFADDAFPMVALAPAGSSSLSFKNVGGVLKLSLTGTYSVSRISVDSNDGEPISGPATVTVDRFGIPVVRMSTEASSSVSLVCSPAVQLDEQSAVEFYISLPPTEFAGGFSLTVTDSEGVVRFNKTVKENNVLRSSVLVMPSIGLGSAHVVNQGIDYIDEYGINHGPGTKIGDVVWAPVNCGYHATDFQWGKLYQWGRKYGQGYSSEDDSYIDASVPEIERYAVDLHVGQAESNADVFFTGSTYYDWLSGHEPSCWLDGKKSDYDPCPDGWRVPSYAECCQLMPLHPNEYLYAEHEGQYGWWFSGETPYSEGIPKVFLPAAGWRANNGMADGRNIRFTYWTSSRNGWEVAQAFSTHSFDAYRSCAYAVRCVQEDPNDKLVPVTGIKLEKEALTIGMEMAYQMKAEVFPAEASHKDVYWYSDNTRIATVDKNGRVTAQAEGTATITAVAGMFSQQCVVTVGLIQNEAVIDYVDEYGVNHGKGTVVNGTVWAPVNCGYKATAEDEKGYPYGKLYQWGRRFGQGYSEEYDESVPEIIEGRVSLEQAESNKNAFIIGTASNDGKDWLDIPDDKLWNSVEMPIKTSNDPCPEGWRVPTWSEMSALTSYKSGFTTHQGQNGYWYSGYNMYSEDVPKVFLPAAGSRKYDGALDYERGEEGAYWTSSPYGVFATAFTFPALYKSNRRADAFSVRCVQENL